MPEPTNDVPDGRVPDVGDTQHLPSQPTQSIPTTGGYSYPGSASSAAAGSPGVPGAHANDRSAGVPGSPSSAGVTLSDDRAAARPKRTGLLIGGLAAALVLGGGAVFAATQLSGGGARPADVLPGDAYAYFQLDIDPSAGQKIAAVRFLDKLPQVRDTLGADDMRKKLWEMAVKDDDTGCVKKFSYDNDIAPWLGDRVGVAMRPGGTKSQPNVVAALQVKDEAKATDTITKLAACGDGSDGVDIKAKDGYVLFSNKGQGDATLAAIGKGTLADNANFKGDMTALGEQGVAAFWFDSKAGLKEFSQLASGTMGLGTGVSKDLDQVKGRFAAALRFDPGYIELAGVARGVENAQGVDAAPGDGSELVNLPANTLAALHVSGADEIIGGAWPQLSKQLKDAAAAAGEDDPIAMVEQEYGLKLPDDLTVLLGKSFTLALPDQDFAHIDDVPAIGVKVVSSDAKRADAVVGKIEDAAGAPGLLTRQVDGDKLFVATTKDYADDLKSGGKLGDSESFKAALGDVSKANFALFVDLDKLEKLYLPELDGDAKSVVQAMRSVGLTSTVTGKGEGTFSLRVAAN